MRCFSLESFHSSLLPVERAASEKTSDSRENEAWGRGSCEVARRTIVYSTKPAAQVPLVECWRLDQAPQEAPAVQRIEGSFLQLGGDVALRTDGTVVRIPDLAPVRGVPALRKLFQGSWYLVCGLSQEEKTGCWGRDGFDSLETEYEFLAAAATRACGIRGGRVECWGRDDSVGLRPPETIGDHRQRHIADPMFVRVRNSPRLHRLSSAPDMSSCCL